MTQDPFFKGFGRYILEKGVDLVRATNMERNNNTDTNALKVKHNMNITAYY